MKWVMKGEECFYIVLTEKIKCDKISCADIMLVWLSWHTRPQAGVRERNRRRRLLARS